MLELVFEYVLSSHYRYAEWYVSVMVQKGAQEEDMGLGNKLFFNCV